MSPRQKVSKDFVPCEEQRKLWPAISGNTINGVGEAERRRPSPIYWHAPEMTPHGPLQVWMMAQGLRVPALHEQREARAAVISRKPVEIAAERMHHDATTNARGVKERARTFGADLVGIARVDPEWVFKGYDFDYPWLVIIGVAMDYERLRTAPEVTAALAVVDGYTNGWRVAQPLADHIRQLGWRAEPRGGPPAGPINLIPAALACGFGELGKHGSIINGKLGSSFRLAAVFTDLPLIADEPADIGAEDFCLNCQVCVDACPVDAIANDKKMVRGVLKWSVDFDRCLPYFNENYGCAVCVAVCPWSAPGRSPRLAEKMLRRRQRRAQGHVSSAGPAVP
jgi:Pyruvate/2-oxoacid:ferredoxin oxidoreductase delta subunit